ncbi:amidohydrolase family protein [Granulicella arctica]|uniref:L-fuconolactonase n=1 Tax=Granulicella arctica TaxID=940613 RepID=A0A7Y9PHU3_9BACT|nr:amidohydrolase family protein [Granulicella arctica]NYF79398.1 L-fuconolactonase [Granulicella arctica]
MAASRMETIDAHHHLWRYTPREYDWIDESMQVLRRDFLPGDLIREMAAADVDGSVVVQARQTLEETRWLLDQADDCAAIRGVVGWAPIAGEEFPGVMEEFEDRPKLKGLRHVIQGEKDEEYILREDFNSGIRCLLGSGLVYDILIFARHLPYAIEFVDEHPEQVFVLDHIAKPMIREGMVAPWAEQMQELGRRENVWCKLSGMVTEADWATWDEASLRPYLDAAVEAFGPSRLMVGSDWPVCLVASEYGRWFEVLRTYFAGFSETERAAVFGGNAVEVYGL